MKTINKKGRRTLKELANVDKDLSNVEQVVIDVEQVIKRKGGL